MKERAATGKLRVVVFQQSLEDGPWWVAQCVEHDIVAQARTMDGVEAEFLRLLDAYVALAAKRKLKDPLAHIPPAPKRYQVLFEKTEARLTGSKQRKDLPQIDARVAH